MHSLDRSFRHFITSNAVDLEVRRIETALAAADCDPCGYDLSGLAVHRLVEETILSLGQHGIEVRQKHWSARGDGSVDLAIELASDADLVFAKMKLR